MKQMKWGLFYFMGNKNSFNSKIMLGRQTFAYLRENNYLYIDKTKNIYNLIDNESIVFLSRPRRFGKSLLVSTLKSLFSGDKGLFEGLYIYDVWEWNQKHPVILIDFTEIDVDTPELLTESLHSLLDDISEDYNLELKSSNLVRKFVELIKKIYKINKQKVVVLIDEYDKAILEVLNDEDKLKENRKIIQKFYNALKGVDSLIEFIFITGVSKFAHTSIFSKLNTPTDITLSNKYSTICGITYFELKKYLTEYIKSFADTQNMTYKECLDEINRWYDGYSWDGENRVFNPYSTLSTLSKTNEKFSSYWFDTGTPSFLMEILKNRKLSINYFEPIIISKSRLGEYKPSDIDDIPLLFQSGYLTIKEKFTDKDNMLNYVLGIPNFEVEVAFKDNLTDLYMEKVENRFRNSQEPIWEEIISGGCKKLSKSLRARIAGLPYHNRVTIDNAEKWKVYSTIFSIWAETMDFYISEEKAIEDGRIDFILENSKKDETVIVEMKYTSDQSKSLNSLINEAFNQISHKKYWWAYTGEIKLMALALKDIRVDDGYIADVKCKIKDAPKEDI